MRATFPTHLQRVLALVPAVALPVRSRLYGSRGSTRLRSSLKRQTTASPAKEKFLEGAIQALCCYAHGVDCSKVRKARETAEQAGLDFPSIHHLQYIRFYIQPSF